MKRVAILCQTGPGGKRGLAEEALRLAAGLAATGRLCVDLILTRSGLALLDPDLGSPTGTWESFLSQYTRILVPPKTSLPPSCPPFIHLSDPDPEKAAAGADLIIRF